MKANELRVQDLQIGSLVMHENGTPMQVTKLRGNDFACGTSYWSYNNIYHPIPITPEILEKNGFKREGVIELYNLYAGIDHRVTIHDDKGYMNSNNEWYVHVDSEDYSTIAGCELTYLHELQALLRICKIEHVWQV